MKSLRAATQRIVWAVLLVFFVVTSTWAMMALLPGDPVSAALGPQASPAELTRARQLYGLDQPVWTRYGRFLARLVHRGPAESTPGEHASCASVGLGLHIDLGYSFSYRKPIVALVGPKLRASTELGLAALLLQLLLGLSAGAAAAMHRGKRIDELLMGLSITASSAPTFVVGLALQYLLAYRLGWLPLDGYGRSFDGWLETLVLPALTLGLYGAAIFARLSRNELAEAMERKFVLAARARGASRRRATIVHAARNALSPVTQLGVLELGALIGGAVVTERVFRWPGLGEMAVVALQNRDAQAIVAVTLLASTAVVLATLLADLLALWLDPRQR